MRFIMVWRKVWNIYSFQVDVVAIEPTEENEEMLAFVAAEHPENIYFFADLSTEGI